MSRSDIDDLATQTLCRTHDSLTLGSTDVSVGISSSYHLHIIVVNVTRFVHLREILVNDSNV